MAMHVNSNDAAEIVGKSPAPLEIDPLLAHIFRELYVSLDAPPQNNPVIGVVSAIRGEGSTAIAHGLARTLAGDLTTMVSLAEVNFESPSLSERYNMSGSPGLSDVLHGQACLTDVRSVVAPNLCFIGSGAPGDDPGRLLYQLPALDPFHGQSRLTGVTILDLPPILAHGYSPLAAGLADVLLLVVRAGVTPADIVREAITRLEGRPPRGVVLNGVRPIRAGLLARRKA